MCCPYIEGGHFQRELNKREASYQVAGFSSRRFEVNCQRKLETNITQLGTMINSHKRGHGSLWNVLVVGEEKRRKDYTELHT
jgi:hypothetical protein